MGRPGAARRRLIGETIVQGAAPASMVVAGRELSKQKRSRREPTLIMMCRLPKVELTQHQFDMLADTNFNCPTGAVTAIELFNAGHADRVPAKLLQYVCSKDERMQGLVNRRNAEIAWSNTPDHIEPPPALNPDVVSCPKAERNPPTKTMATSKTGTAAVTTTTASIAVAAQAANEALEPIKQGQGERAGARPVRSSGSAGPQPDGRDLRAGGLHLVRSPQPIGE